MTLTDADNEGTTHYATITTFLASVLNLSPFACTTVMETYPVFPVFISLTTPDLPACLPPMTLHPAPSFSLFAGLVFMKKPPFMADLHAPLDQLSQK